jgi:phosphoribosylformylglycinamidine cyclo-ligase
MQGLHDAAQTAEIVVTGGEIAELGGRISGFGSCMHFNWCATAAGVIPAGREPIDGKAVSRGDSIIALQSRGFRSNGFSLLRRIMTEAFGPDWHATPYGNGASWGEQLLEPALIYSPGIVGLFKAGFKIHGIAHITGGGICDNLARVLAPNGLGGLLTDLYPPLEAMKRVQILGNVDDATAYRFWNMGTAMLLVTDAADASDIITHLAEHSFAAKVAGKVIPEPSIELRTMGIEPTTLLVPGRPGKSA